jgi:hypothetical protein
LVILESGKYQIIYKSAARQICLQSKDRKRIPATRQRSFLYIFAGLVFTIDRVQRRRLIHKEREQSRLREAELRAQTAEARNQTLQLENERKKNVELLSEIGKEITASLSIKHIIDIVYENINDVMDASVFGIGIYNQDLKRIEMPATKEKGKTLPLFSYPIDDVNRPAMITKRNTKNI